MSLRFPNARLFMHNLLADGSLSGADAIALTACEFGLVDRPSVQSAKVAIKDRECACMEAARQVLMQYFENRPKSSDVNAEQIWKSLEEEASKYQKRMENNTDLSPKKTCCGAGSHDCSKFAPALFDLLLQQIRRYP